MKLLTYRPWKIITQAVKKSPGACHVAVAYFGREASKLLPLQSGSVLIIDFSETAVRSGHACPSEVLHLIRRGVEVHSVTNLHAKVFVVGDSVFIGSTNVSQSSANTLVEAVAYGTDLSLVRQSRKFVESLRGEHITPEYARRMAKYYKPPTFGDGAGTKRKSDDSTPTHARTWVVQLEHVTRSKVAEAAEKKGRPIAQRRLQAPGRFIVDEFDWGTKDLTGKFKDGDQIIQVIEEKSKGFFVSPPERVLYVEGYNDPKDGPGSIVFIEKPTGGRRKALKQIRAKIGSLASLMRPDTNLELLTDTKLIHRIHQLWPKQS